jgi:hypothetical protein
LNETPCSKLTRYLKGIFNFLIRIRIRGNSTHEIPRISLGIPAYTISSSLIALDDYVNQEVTIFGQKVDGYPVEGGPDYLEVLEIK